MDRTSYAVALGSNRRHGRHGAPARVVAAAILALQEAGLAITARSSIRATPAFGGAGRAFANAAVIVQTGMEPAALLLLLKQIERRFGRRPGRRWGPRVLDLDILLQFPSVGRGPVTPLARLDPGLRRGALTIPHPGLPARRFVLQPLLDIAPGWRHPVLSLTVRQLRMRLTRAKPVDRSGPRP